ncbi:hypothetical protein [Aminipila sp.]|uniref:hypothetical protein n=1 Tax=Aminipila sp. TaxID=2060095 RepID=UPI0028989FF0|nr:hypothetical protein [Aminipila sp.]
MVYRLRYGVEEYKRHYYNIERGRRYEIENYNPKIYAAIFLLYDLMSKSYVDQLYRNSLNYGIADRKYFFDDIMTFLRMFFDYDENTFYNSSNAQNFLYKILIKECYRQLERFYLSGNKDDFPISGYKIKYKKTFPIFIMIEDTKGNVLIYN